MILPYIPSNGGDRLAELFGYAILDTPSEQEFQEVVWVCF